MAVDFDYLKKKLNALNEQTAPRTPGPGKKLYWKPTGTHVIRLLPNIFNPGDPFLELYFHYNLNPEKRAPIPSPISFGGKDPVLEFAQQLQSKGNSQDYKMGKRMEPSRRPHAIVLIRGEEDEGPKYWGFSDTVYKELIATMLDPDYGDITDPMNGRDITVTYQPPAAEGAFAKTTIRPKPNVSPITNDPKVLQMIKEITPPEVAFAPPSYDELREMLEQYLQAGDTANAPVAPATTPTPAPVPATSMPNTASTPAAAVDAFEMLFKNPGGTTEVPF